MCERTGDPWPERSCTEETAMLSSCAGDIRTCAELSDWVEQGRIHREFEDYHTSNRMVRFSAWSQQNDPCRPPHQPGPHFVGEHRYPGRRAWLVVTARRV